MKNLLSAASRDRLVALASARALLAFDFDGTLAPLVDRREAARMRDHTAALFTRLCTLYPCAVISGRARADVTQRLDAAPVRHVVGSHGLETDTVGDHFERAVGDAARILELVLGGEGGVDIEDKRHSLAIHYRRARRKSRVREAVHRAVASLPAPMRIVPGKLVLNVVPADAPHKGDALLDLRAAESADVALYVGDDVTDEDVFALSSDRVLTVRVGASKTSAAAYYLRTQSDIDRLLSRLIRLRAADG